MSAPRRGDLRTEEHVAWCLSRCVPPPTSAGPLPLLYARIAARVSAASGGRSAASLDEQFDAALVELVRSGDEDAKMALRGFEKRQQGGESGEMRLLERALRTDRSLTFHPPDTLVEFARLVQRRASVANSVSDWIAAAADGGDRDTRQSAAAREGVLDVARITEGFERLDAALREALRPACGSGPHRSALASLRREGPEMPSAEPAVDYLVDLALYALIATRAPNLPSSMSASTKRYVRRLVVASVEDVGRNPAHRRVLERCASRMRARLANRGVWRDFFHDVAAFISSVYLWLRTPRGAATAAAVVAAVAILFYMSPAPPDPIEPIRHDELRVVAAGAGRHHTCGLLPTGDVVCWGGNGVGQLGDAVEDRARTTPHVPVLSSVRELSIGEYTSCAIRNDESLWCWGDNSYGRAGASTDIRRLAAPTRVEAVGRVTRVAVGTLFACAITTAGRLSCWGYDHRSGGVGGSAGGEAPVDVPDVGDVEDVAVGDGFSCVRRRSGEVLCWGGNVYGQTGTGAPSSGAITDPTPVVGLDDAAVIATGGFHACALRQSGSIVCWGANSEGSLGVAGLDADRSAVPLEVPLPSTAGSARVLEIACGAAHSCARLSDGSVYCWGYNAEGQVGDGTLERARPPVRVPLGEPALGITLGSEHSCAWLESRALVCWGRNENGQLGDGTTERRTSPTRVGTR